MTTMLMKAFWVGLFITIVASVVFLGTFGIPFHAVTVVKVIPKEVILTLKMAEVS